MMLRKFAAVAAVVGSVLSASAELPEGYAPIPYVQSDGTAYIDTGYKPNGSTKIEADIDLMQGETGDHYVFGADDRKAKGNAGLVFETYDATSPRVQLPGTGYERILDGCVVASEYRDFHFSYAGGVMRMTSVAAGADVTCDKSGNWASNGFADYQFQNTIYLFSRHGSSGDLNAVGAGSKFSRIRSFKIWEGDTLVRDLVPAIRISDGQLGLYDVADHLDEDGYQPFYSNASAKGKFGSGVEGDDLVGLKRLAYVEGSVGGKNCPQYIDTKVVFKDQPRVDARIMYLSPSGDVDIMGMGTAAADCFIVDNNDGLKTCYYRYSAAGYKPFKYDASLKDRWVDFSFGNIITVDGAKIGEVTSWNFANNTQTFYLFKARDTVAACLQRVAWVKMYDGEQLVRDYIPVMQDGVAGLFDRVEMKFYPSDGSQPLLAGPVIPIPPGDFTQFTISGSPLEVGAVSPAYGRVKTFDSDEIECTAPASVDQDGIRATLLGWELSYDGGEPQSGDTSPVTATVVAGKMDLKWKWSVKCRLTVEQSADGTVAGTDGWHDHGATVTLTATPSEGHALAYWKGDVPEELRKDNPLTLPMDRARTVSAQFCDPNVHYVDYENGTDSGDGTVAPGWKTLAYAVAHAGAGEEIVLAAGRHAMSADVTVDRALTIRGESHDACIVGKTAGYNAWTRLYLDADGITFHSLTMFKNTLTMTGDSVVSNVVFTSGGETVETASPTASASAGRVECCSFTNVVTKHTTGIELKGSALVENCLFRDNRSTTNGSNWHGRVLDITPGDDAYVVVRNCTVMDNTFYYGGGQYDNLCKAVYVYGTAQNLKFYNNIVWNNRNTLDEELNYNTTAGKGKYVGWIGNCISPTDVLPADNGNFSGDPKLLVDRMHIASDSPCRDTAWTGIDVTGVAYAPSYDFFGVERGNTTSVGAVEYVEIKMPMVVTPVAPTANRVIAPGTLPFSCTIEGDYVEPLEYYWNFDGEGKVTADTASVDLGVPGAYHNPTLTVTDAEGQEKTVAVEGDFKVVVLFDETRYVDSANGNDGNDGTAPDKAWKTLAHAVEASDEGYTLVLLPGEHPLPADITIDRILTITGEGAVIKGKAVSYLSWATIDLTVDGALLHSLTMFKGFVKVSAESTVSNVVFTTGGEETDNNTAVVDATAGLVTGCCFTNNVNRSMAALRVAGSAVVENCMITKNRTVVCDSNSCGRMLTVRPDISSCLTVRNCTIVDNTFYYGGGQYQVDCPAVHVDGIPANARIYNNIIWNNRNSQGEVRNYNTSMRDVDYAEWKCNCTTPTAVLPEDGGNIDAEPLFEGGDPFAPAYESPCRNAGNDDLAPMAVDLFGNPRKVSRHVDIGAVENQRVNGLMMIVR